MPTELYCAKCNARVHQGDTECPMCKASLADASAVVIKQNDALKEAFRGDVKGAEEKKHEYAGFWLRFVAWIIDDFIFTVVGLIIRGIMVVAYLGGSRPEFFQITSWGDYWSLVIISFLIGWLYYAIMESMPTQGTIGKMVMKLRVADMKDEPVTFPRASARYFGRYICSFTLGIGYLMIAFTRKKQGLHDMIAGCLVMKK